MPIRIAQGIMQMQDRDGETYLVDEDLSYILVNRTVWTDTETRHLMLAEISHKQKQTVMEHQLAVWLYRIMSLNDLPTNITVDFKDHNPRNCCHQNLVRLQKKESLRHDLQDQETHTTLIP